MCGGGSADGATSIIVYGSGVGDSPSHPHQHYGTRVCPLQAALMHKGRARESCGGARLRPGCWLPQRGVVAVAPGAHVCARTIMCACAQDGAPRPSHAAPSRHTHMPLRTHHRSQRAAPHPAPHAGRRRRGGEGGGAGRSAARRLDGGGLRPKAPSLKVDWGEGKGVAVV